MQVAQWLEQESIDLLEISGGTYEQPRLLGVEGIGEYEDQNIAKSTLKREAYFVDFAIELRKKDLHSDDGNRRFSPSRYNGARYRKWCSRFD